ncbi:hypothetical protein LCGC14_2717340, partial [marine sediment metagenome]
DVCCQINLIVVVGGNDVENIK